MPGSADPDSCCFCLTLRSGVTGIGGGNCVIYLSLLVGWVGWVTMTLDIHFLLPRYLTSSTIDPGGVRDGLPVTTLDISMILVTIIQVQIYLQTKKEFDNLRSLPTPCLWWGLSRGSPASLYPGWGSMLSSWYFQWWEVVNRVGCIDILALGWNWHRHLIWHYKAEHELHRVCDRPHHHGDPHRHQPLLLHCGLHIQK